MKRIAILLFIASALAAQAQTLSITSTSGASTLTAKPGDAITLTITSSANGTSGVVGLEWTVIPPTGWPAPTQLIGPMGAGSQKTLACGPAACLLYGWYAGVGNITQIMDGLVAVVNATVPATAVAGDYKFALNPVYGAAWDGGEPNVTQGAPMVVTVTVPPPVTYSKYDLNKDGKVDGADVGIAVDQSIGKVPCSTADINGDGLCTTRDVQLVIAAAHGDIPK